MAEVARKLEGAAKLILEALDASREKGEEAHDYYRRMADAYVNALSSIHCMRAYGKIDPPEYELIERRIKEGQSMPPKKR